MGYEVKKLALYSMVDNKKYDVKTPLEAPDMFVKFENVIERIKTFSLEEFTQDNAEKCKNCIYEPACDRGLL